jgi:hypothetical protein
MSMRVWTCCIAVLVAAVAALEASAPAAAACSIGRLFSVRAEVFVLATAGADTVRTGPGRVRYTVPASDTAALAGIHGQRFRLDRLGGDLPPELAGREGSEAVLVPYSSECREVWPWTRGLWAEPGSQMLVDGSLRVREQWVDGRPTFDVNLPLARYPEGYTMWLDSIPGDPLSGTEMFDLTAVLPTYEQAEAAPAAAYAPLLAWARANPRLAARFPATPVLEEANEALQPCVSAYDPHPAAGTYRAQVIVRQTDTLTAFFRTDARGHPMCRPAALRLDLATVRPRLADTARLYVHGAASEAAIPETNREANAGGCSVAIADVVNQPSTGAEGRRSWRADYNFLVLPGCFPGHAGVKQAVDAIAQAYSADARTEPGWFREEAGEGMRFEQRWSADGRVMLEVRATRTGTRTLRDYGG